MLAVANDKGKITILQIASLFKDDDGKTRLTLTVCACVVCGTLARPILLLQR